MKPINIIWLTRKARIRALEFHLLKQQKMQLFIVSCLKSQLSIDSKVTIFMLYFILDWTTCVFLLVISSSLKLKQTKFPNLFSFPSLFSFPNFLQKVCRSFGWGKQKIRQVTAQNKESVIKSNKNVLENEMLYMWQMDLGWMWK